MLATQGASVELGAGQRRWPVGLGYVTLKALGKAEGSQPPGISRSSVSSLCDGSRSGCVANRNAAEAQA